MSSILIPEKVWDWLVRSFFTYYVRCWKSNCFTATNDFSEVLLYVAFSMGLASGDCDGKSIGMMLFYRFVRYNYVLGASSYYLLASFNCDYQGRGYLRTDFKKADQQINLNFFLTYTGWAKSLVKSNINFKFVLDSPFN